MQIHARVVTRKTLPEPCPCAQTLILAFLSSATMNTPSGHGVMCCSAAPEAALSFEGVVVSSELIAIKLEVQACRNRLNFRVMVLSVSGSNVLLKAR